MVPGSVSWRRVSKRPQIVDPDQPPPELSRFKCVENTNYSLDLARTNRMHIVGIQGADIVDGTRTLVLGLVWQMMRQNVTQTLASLSKGGREITDSDIVRWANDTVRKAGKSSSMRSFKDPANKNAIFFLDLLDAMKPGYVDYSLVVQGRNDDECKNNGRLFFPSYHCSCV
jgi:plastin-1